MVSHFLSGALGALLALNYPSQESQINKITTETLIILQKFQRPLLQKITEEASKNTNYLINAKPLGIENGVPKGIALCTALYLAYYGYTKHQENQQNQKKKKDSNHEE